MRECFVVWDVSDEHIGNSTIIYDTDNGLFIPDALQYQYCLVQTANYLSSPLPISHCCPSPYIHHTHNTVIPSWLTSGHAGMAEGQRS